MNKKTFLYIVFLLICVLVTLLLAELIIKVKVRNVNWHDPNTQFDAQLGWSPVPGRHIEHAWGQISSNSLGFRSAEIDQSKKHVIVLGDSVVFGHGVGDRENMPYHLHKLMAKHNYQVHNLGVSGYGIGQSYLNLEKHIARLDNLEQVVFVIFSYNDFGNTGSNTNYGKRKPLFRFQNRQLIKPTGHIKKYNLRNLFSMSQLLTVLSQKNKGFGQWMGNVVGDERLEFKENELVVAHLLHRMRDLVESHGAKFLVVVSPSTYDFVQKEKDHVWFEKFFQNNQSDFLYINYFDHLKKHVGNLESLYNDWGHYNNNGNKLLAQSIYHRISQQE